jgi:uncharacterized LabA/DUF88 family protein
MNIRKDKIYAYIDSNNLNLGVQSLGWKLDFKRFRIYLKEKYNVSTAYMFIGYVSSNQSLYTSLQKASFVLVFKPTLPNKDGSVKGNIDADLVLQVMIDYKDNKFDKVIIITSDGDFYSLVNYLYEQDKLLYVISPYLRCSVLLKKTAREKLLFMDNLINKLEYK